MLLNNFPYSSSTALLSLYYCVDVFHIILEFFAYVKKDWVFWRKNLLLITVV